MKKYLGNLFAKIIQALKNEYTRKKVIFFSVLISGSLWLFWGIPLPTNLSSEEYPVSTKLLDRGGNLIYEIYSDKRRTPIKLEDLPDFVKESTISIEDKDFYKHYGFSYTGIARSVYNIIIKRKLQGGSTLTQQLVKNVLLSPERTVKRKVREFFLTMVVEGVYSKNQILEMYLNQIPYGSTAYGIEAAAELYFDKSAKNLSLAEAAFGGLAPKSNPLFPFWCPPRVCQRTPGGGFKKDG